MQLLSWFAKHLRMNLNSQRQAAARQEVDALRREQALMMGMVQREQQVGAGRLVLCWVSSEMTVSCSLQ